MANLIVTLMSIAVILSGVSLTAQGSFKSMANLSDDWKQMEVRSGDIARTGLEVINTYESSPYAYITIRNSGQTSLANFEAWDVVVQYYDSSNNYHQLWLPYTTSLPPGNNQWTVAGIYVDASRGIPEVFQPNMFDPGEQMIIRIRLSPAAKQSAHNLVVIGTPNGVTASTMF